jgi:hypothetical protein
MREQTIKIVQKKKVNISRDWTCNVTTTDSSSSKNRGERHNIIFRKQTHGLSPVLSITELTSSKLTHHL